MKKKLCEMDQMVMYRNRKINETTKKIITIKTIPLKGSQCFATLDEKTKCLS